jgi:hypothetical protein
MGKPRALRALGVCITISVVYSIVFFIASWAAGGPGAVGRAVLLPRLLGSQQVFWGLMLLVWVLGLSLLFLFSKCVDRALEGVLRRGLEAWLGEGAESVARRWYRIAGATTAASIVLAAIVYAWAAEALAVALAFALTVTLALATTGIAVAFALAAAAAAAAAAAIAVGVAGAVAGAWAVAVAVGVAMLVARAGAGGAAEPGALYAILIGGMVLVFGGRTASNASVPLLLFFVILPIANALLDWPSWWVSRRLGQDLLTIVSGNQTSGANPAGVRTRAWIGRLCLSMSCSTSGRLCSVFGGWRCCCRS